MYYLCRMGEEIICGIKIDRLKYAIANLKSLYNVNSKNIIEVLTENKSLNVQQIEDRLNIAQSQISAYLSKLKELGVVKIEKKEKTFVYYKVNEKRIKEINKAVSSMK